MNTEQNQVKEFLEIECNELDKFRYAIDYDALSKAKQTIINAEKKQKRIHVTGIGKPSYVAGYVASLFSSTGTPTYELHGTEAIHGSSGQVLLGDVVIAISNSGETAELKATVNTLKANGAIIIAVTGEANSWLAKVSDIALIAKVDQEGDQMNKPPRASIIAEIMMMQSLSVLLQNEKGLTPQQYVKWHPGGSLGKCIMKAKNE